MTSNEIETMIKNLTTNKIPRPDVFTGEIYQTFRDELAPILMKLSQKFSEEITLLTHSMRFLDNKIRLRYHTKKENYRPIPLENIDTKFLNKMLANNPTMH